MTKNTGPAQLTEIYVTIPILPGKAEAWRRFVQELQGSHQREWTAWCARVGLKRLQVRLHTTPHQMIVVFRAEVKQTDGRPQSLLTDKAPFDGWLRDQILALHGLDIAQLWASGQQDFLLDIETELALV